MVAEKINILKVIETYALVVDQLRKHDQKYPSANYLKSVTYEGLGTNHKLNIQWGLNKQTWFNIIGNGRDIEASEAIMATVDKQDPRPTYVCVWDGPREIAQAIWKARETRSKDEFETFLAKLRIFLIGYQDATHHWLMESFPDLFIIESQKTYQDMFGV